ncbi:MAG: SIMPL domain-containing protein [Acidobacteriota bacterium]|nr:SIMPL domain-containing protein [Acidobacteriota bacterium]
MKKIVPAILALLFLAPTFAGAQPSAPELPVVVASGEGVVKAAPDQAWVRIGAESRSKNPKDAQPT